MTKIIEVNAIGSSYGNYVAAFILNESGIAAATSSTFITHLERYAGRIRIRQRIS